MLRLRKRATFNGCSQNQQSQLNAAATSAASIAFSAYAYTTGISGNTYWFNRWFGPYSASSIAAVRNNFQSIADTDFSSFTYDCSCTRTDFFTIIGQYIFQS
jgi:peptidyl-Lys metalloendopeptidase